MVNFILKMGRTSLLRSVLLPASSRVIYSPASLTPLNGAVSTLGPSADPCPSPFGSVSRQLAQPFLFTERPFSSSSDPTGINLIKTEGEFNESLKNVHGNGVPAIYYFTASWCGPCRMIAPVIEELSKKYPHVAINKIDVDLEALGDTLSRLQIASVPTFQFFQGGKKATEIIGADVKKLKDTMETLYKKE